MTVRMPTVWAMMLGLVRFFYWQNRNADEENLPILSIRKTSNVNGAKAPSREEFYNV